MNKISSVLFVFFAVWICVKSYNGSDVNEDITRSIVAENAFVLGDSETSNTINAKISNPSKRFESNRYIELKRDILSKKYEAKTIGTKISELPNSNLKVPLYSLAAKIYRDIDKEASDAFIFRAYCNLLGANYSLYESYYLEAIDTLSDIDDKMAQETASSALLNLRYSHDRAILLHKLISKKYSRQKLLKFWTSDKQKVKKYGGIIWHAKVLASKKPNTPERLERAFKYSAIQFAMPWSIKKWEDYKFPLLSYICFCVGDKPKYEMYREKSLSKEQLKNMQAGYFQYVEYAARIFCLTGDYDDAIKLLQTLPNGYNKRRIIKRLARHLTSSKQGLEKTIQANLL